MVVKSLKSHKTCSAIKQKKKPLSKKDHLPDLILKRKKRGGDTSSRFVILEAHDGLRTTLKLLLTYHRTYCKRGYKRMCIKMGQRNFLWIFKTQ